MKISNSYFSFFIKNVSLLIFVISYSFAVASDGKSKFEKLWKQQGPVKILQDESEKLGLSSKDMEVFVFTNREKIAARAGDYWKNVNIDTGWDNYSKLEKLLSEDEEFYVSLINEFHINKTAGTDKYKQAVSSLEKFLIPPATGSSGTICDNVGFESNTFFNWQVWLGRACIYNENFTCYGFGISTYPSGQVQIVGAGWDAIATSLPMVNPGGNYSLRMENQVNGGDATKVTYTFDVDVTKPSYKYNYALVLEDPGNDHPRLIKPFFDVTFYNNTRNEKMKCGSYHVTADENDKEFRSDKFQPVGVPGSPIRFTQWQTSVVDFTDYIGENITVTFVVSDCAWGGHLGYAYIDGSCFKENINIGNCLADGTRLITTDNVFPEYKWFGNGIVGKATGSQLKVNQGGKYTLKRYTSSGCISSEIFSINDCPQPDIIPCSLTVSNITIGPCDNASNLFNVDFSFSLVGGPTKGVVKIMDGKIEYFINLPITNPYSFHFPNLLADGKIHPIQIYIYPDRYISHQNFLCSQTINVQAPSACYLPTGGECINCIGGFIPTVDSTYAISAWVRDANAPVTATTYTRPYIQILYGSGVPTPPPFFAKGKTIEGWQRIYEEFTIPHTAAQVTVQLGSTTGTVSFDDIRIYPLKASMKSYVYDPKSMKLVAVLDENNYATFYEYDQEGVLIRTKKETERGIVTISENRQSNPKK